MEDFKIDFLRYTLNKYSIIQYNNFIYSSVNLENENFETLLSSIYLKTK